MTSRFRILIGFCVLIASSTAGAKPVVAAKKTAPKAATAERPTAPADAVTTSDTKVETKAETKAETAPATTPAVDNSGPRIVVPPLLGIDRKKGAPPHKLLIAELTAAIGPRVVPVLDTWQAQNSLGLVATDFQSSAGVEKFATFLSAERAVTVEIADTMTIARVYASLTGAPPLVIEVPRKKKSPLDAKWAKAVAAAVATRAQDALAPRVEAPVVDMSAPEPTTTTTDPIEPPPATSTPLPALPFFVGAVGGGVALRDVEVGGTQAGKVVPMQQGPVPSLSVHLALRPLVLMDQHAWWNDLLIEANGRHGFVDARAGDVACTVDDDDVGAALSWRARLSDNPLVPRVGAGVSGSFERFTIGGCSLPVLSTSTTQAAGFARLGWNV
ncbi:MAG TPA: hypothetical protein VGF99_15625, partial [Myxococcota bacterium]